MPDILERCKNCPYTEECSYETKLHFAYSSSYFCHVRRKYMLDALVEEGRDARVSNDG